MELTFENWEEYNTLFYMVRDSDILWRKRRMEVQGKICLQADGSETQYTLEECEEGIAAAAAMETMLEARYNKEWDV